MPANPHLNGPCTAPRPKHGFFSPLLACALAFALCGCSMPWVKGSQKAKRDNPCIVLALPASGNYAPLAAKIKKGAAEAQRNLMAAGINARVENINTEDPEWLKKLAALPEMCVVVGGPLQDKKYIAARNAGIMQKRAFFSFLPTLQGSDEGKVAWRFFPGPQDQIDALIKFATDDIGIRSYGAYYPNDTYGRRMTDLMEKSLAKKSLTLRKASYPQGAPGAATLKPLLNTTYVGAGKTAIPQTEFEAIFLPDSWKNMDMITNSLIINGEDRLALLGTTLWEASLSGKQVPAGGKYELAVFPAAWNKKRAPKALQGAGNDFWSALGYDFVNFAARVELDMRGESAEVTRQAQRASGAIKAMAPINWNGAGLASQNLYIFQVTPAGAAPVDVAAFRQKRSAISDRAALRMQNAREAAAKQELEEPASQEEGEGATQTTQVSIPEYSDEGAAQSAPSRPLPGAHAGPATAPQPDAARPASSPKVQGTMSPTPVPSYKLRLPAKP